MFVDTHCHLDAPEFDADRLAVEARARAAGVACLVIPAVAAAHFEAVRDLAHRTGHAYALGLHPLWLAGAGDDDLRRLAAALNRWRDDPHLVAVGEIGLDHFVPQADRAVQQRFFQAQLDLARQAGLPVLLHGRRATDAVLAGVRRSGVPGGIFHAFNGSRQQAEEALRLGLRLGFGGAMTHERARQIRERAATLPAQGLVLETDAPDIPPHWLYRTAADRAAEGGGHGRNEPGELPRIAQTLAGLRGWTLEQTARSTTAQALAALPRLALACPALVAGLAPVPQALEPAQAAAPVSPAAPAGPASPVPAP